MPEGILPDFRGGKPLPRDPWRVITMLEQRIEALERRLDTLEAKRPVGRPRKEEAA